MHDIPDINVYIWRGDVVNAKIKLVMQENISDRRQSKNISVSHIPWKISFFNRLRPSSRILSI
jgi:hypothetical protein